MAKVEDMHKIETVTGHLFDLAKPDPATVCLYDIAYGLSRQPRFVGHTKGAILNVAQHSLIVERMVRRELLKRATKDRQLYAWVALNALLHDAHEAYIGDISRPMAMLLDCLRPVKDLKARVQRAILMHIRVDVRVPVGVPLQLSEEHQDLIKRCDNRALVYEAYCCMHSQGASFSINDPLLSGVLMDIHAEMKNGDLEPIKIMDEQTAFLCWREEYATLAAAVEWSNDGA